MLAADATMGEAAARVGSSYLPLLALVDEQGRATGVLREETIRLGLAAAARPHDRAGDFAEPLGALPLSEDGRPLPWTPPSPPRVTDALLMAGGRGRRLHPLTAQTPKPLLEIDGRPLLHRLLEQVAAAGVTRCFLSVHYLKEHVRASVGDGTMFGLAVEYLEEDEPLGTAGALGLLPQLASPLLVMNGDLLSDVNLTALLAWHERHGNTATVGTHLYEVEVPFGLAHCSEQRLDRLEEKPTLRLPVNAGIYAFAPTVLHEVPRGQPHDMVTWLNDLGRRGLLGHFPIVERWHDIGSPDELRRLAEG